MSGRLAYTAIVREYTVTTKLIGIIEKRLRRIDDESRNYAAIQSDERQLLDLTNRRLELEKLATEQYNHRLR